MALITCLSLALRAYAQPTGYEGYQVVRIAVAGQDELETLRELEALGADFQVWSEGVGIGTVDVRISPAARPILDGSGLCYEIIVADLQQHIDRLFGGERARGGCAGNFFDFLRTYNEHVQLMQDLAAAYPDLADMIMLGLSVEGRPLWALRITGMPAGTIQRRYPPSPYAVRGSEASRGVA